MNDKTAELLAKGAAELGVPLTDFQLDKFRTLALELQKWNNKINLTAVTADEQIVVKHFLDSLTLRQVVGETGRLLDLGSGGGFPALPLKIVLTKLEVVSVDAVEKKIMFQRHMGRLLDLRGFTAVHERGERLVHDYPGNFDWVVSRAFADIASFVRLALPLLKEDGRIVAMKGSRGAEEAAAAEPALLAMGFSVLQAKEFRLPLSGDARCLVVLGKQGLQGES
jgi:16S rRNA (guanine527-N7)-methyltransferase